MLLRLSVRGTGTLAFALALAVCAGLVVSWTLFIRRVTTSLLAGPGARAQAFIATVAQVGHCVPWTWWDEAKSLRCVLLMSGIKEGPAPPARSPASPSSPGASDTCVLSDRSQRSRLAPERDFPPRTESES